MFFFAFLLTCDGTNATATIQTTTTLHNPNKSDSTANAVHSTGYYYNTIITQVLDYNNIENYYHCFYYATTTASYDLQCKSPASLGIGNKKLTHHAGGKMLQFVAVVIKQLELLEPPSSPRRWRVCNLNLLRCDPLEMRPFRRPFRVCRA